MIEKAKKQRKGSVGEEDIATLLQRYTATTVLALLHEVANCTEVKIDWNALVVNTSTGISNAKEFQMLWRHLAYRHTLLENFEDGDQPLDDDSDLEYELEAVPAVSTEASTEAAACVKVLIASGLPSDSIRSGSTVEAPLTINIPNGLSSRALDQQSCSMQGTNITVPVSVQKQPVPSATFTDLDTNRSAVGNLQNRRKRKPWSEAEDMELIAAVKKCGEGNWANMLRGDFKGDRTASQLSQRWSIIRKRNGNLNLGGKSNGTQLSEAQLAARHAMSVALKMPVKSITAGTTTTNSLARTNSAGNSAITNATKHSMLITGETSMSGSSFLQSLKQSQENLTSKTSPVGSLGPTAKSRVPLKKPVLKSAPSSDAMVRATAVAAGARIASPSDAASLLKAAQAKNAVHIMPTGGGPVKSSMATSGMPTHSESHPNVHYIRTGLASTPISTYPAATPSASTPSSVKAIPPAVEHTPTVNGASLDVRSKQNNDVSCTQACELPSKQTIKTEEISISELGPPTKEQIQGDQACISANSEGELVKENKLASNAEDESVKENKVVASPDINVELKGTSEVGNLASSMNVMKAENANQVIVDVQPKGTEIENDTEMIDSIAGAGDNHDAVEEDGENQDR
ncbi:GAMYB transcription factor [Parasponia andersonii]|uniref:GAMYB transcription factor n=1 Tax=Parasponia andersonii TaxID=3476 RepID=A0A2P5BLV6_PARAD|nr:GAMYB transcription factor [Parasponia andersonii]